MYRCLFIPVCGDQLSSQLAVFMSQVVVRVPGSRGVPFTGVLRLVAVVMDAQAPSTGAVGVIAWVIEAREKLA